MTATNLSLRDATTKLLRRGCYRRGLTVNQIIAKLTTSNIWTTSAPTPDRTLRTVLCTELAKGKESEIVKVPTDDGVKFLAAR